MTMDWRRYLALGRDFLTIRCSGLFNASWYRAAYPDIRAAGVHPILHYLKWGARDGRDPSWLFSTLDYVGRYPDVAQSGLNPLLHYLRIGKAEGRVIGSHRVLNCAVSVPYVPVQSPWDWFAKATREHQPRRVLEAGTLQAVPGVSTHSRRNFPWVADKDYVRLDLFPGADVDVVGDLHRLPAEWSGSFDCFIANAVFEHLDRPWLAAKEVARVLAPGGLFFVATHQCFPYHGYPSDFFRFSREALRLIFEDAGLEVAVSDYRDRCMIVPPAEIVGPAQVGQWNELFPSYILVAAAGRKPEIEPGTSS